MLQKYKELHGWHKENLKALKELRTNWAEYEYDKTLMALREDKDRVAEKGYEEKAALERSKYQLCSRFCPFNGPVGRRVLGSCSKVPAAAVAQEGIKVFFGYFQKRIFGSYIIFFKPVVKN